VLQNCNYKLHYDKYTITDRTVHKNRPDIQVDKTTKQLTQ